MQSRGRTREKRRTRRNSDKIPKGLHYQIVGGAKNRGRVRSVIRHRADSSVSFILRLVPAHLSRRFFPFSFVASVSFVLVHFYFSFSDAERRFRTNDYDDDIVAALLSLRPYLYIPTTGLLLPRKLARVYESPLGREECFGNQFCQAIHRGESNAGLSMRRRNDSMSGKGLPMCSANYLCDIRVRARMRMRVHIIVCDLTDIKH